jgi:mannose-6-phosphate isomerase
MKLLDARESLSVQVHPDDDYAAANENGELGKSELWYVLAAKPGAQIVYGVLPGVGKQRFAAALGGAEALEPLLSWIEVKAGEMYHIPAGLVHALGAGVVVAEIQQSSDTTYRVYDYGRLDDAGIPRELHIAKALDVITFADDAPAVALTGV